MNGEQPGLVIVRGAADGFVQEIIAGPHHLRSDEPTSVGEPRPARRLTISFSVRWVLARRRLAMYARRKKWPLERVTVRLRHSRVHAEDCAACETQNARLTVIDHEIALAVLCAGGCSRSRIGGSPAGARRRRSPA
jgi:putative redox protein